MVKKSLLLLAAAISVSGSTYAQRNACATDEAMQKARALHPEIVQYEAQMETQIKEGLKHIDLTKYAAKGTGTRTGVIPSIPVEDLSLDVYDIPVVVHVVHDYGSEYVKDDDIYQAVKDWNIVYMKQNPDTSDVIYPFQYHDSAHRGYIGNPRIILHLANRDPHGNPTKGITHEQSYLAANGGDQAKLNGWPNSSYINIWLVKAMPGHASAAAYAYYPSAAQAPAMAPYDGVIALYTYLNTDKTINHEIGHVLNLKHPWGDTNNPDVSCGDDDVDDTPPTKGHNITGCTAAALYDTTCSNGYVKNYLDNNNVPFTVDYPDTNNSQNIMDYTYCSRMFTKGQVLRMHQALNLDVANRANLWSTRNLAATGLLADSTKDPATDIIPMADLAPIPDFSVEKGKTTGVPPNERTYFYCANDAGLQFGFTNRSWGDTLTSVKFHFSNGATVTDTTLTGAAITSATGTVYNSFSQPGWVTVDMDVNGNGGTHATSSRLSVYAADGANPVVLNPNNYQYFMEFSAAEMDKFPIFNYYNNGFKWDLRNNNGFLDKTCISYRGFDNRPYPQNETGTPGGDFDDFFTPAYDLTAMATGNCNLNFMSAGTFRTGNPSDMKDSLVISYSTTCGKSWTTLKAIGKHDLANNGTSTIAYEPLGSGEWSLQSIDIPAAARTNKTFFRFRYKPGVDANQTSTGNNFYMDRLNISNFPLGVNTLVNNDHNISLAPNPTNGSSYVIISNKDNGTASVNVTDVTGRVVYSTTQKLSNSIERIEIPASVLHVKGIYMVHVKTDTQSQTEKLVAY